jgi:hypothetical protein
MLQTKHEHKVVCVLNIYFIRLHKQMRFISTVEPRFTNASYPEQIGSQKNLPKKKNVSGDERCLE